MGSANDFFLLAAADTARMFAASALRVTFGASFAAIVAVALPYGVVHVHNANTVDAGTFLLGHIHHQSSPS